MASINPNGTLTPFTNILLDPNIPQIFSTGEEIKSSIPAKTIDDADQIANKKTKDQYLMLIKMSLIDSKEQEKLPTGENLENMRNNSMDLKVVNALSESLATLLHFQEPINRRNLSGTSMATPTVTGIVARYIAEKMIKEKITADQVYLHPDFKPEKIIADVMKMSKTNTLTPLFTVKMLVDGIKTWEKSKGERVQANEINRLIRVRCESVFAR